MTASAMIRRARVLSPEPAAAGVDCATGDPVPLPLSATSGAWSVPVVGTVPASPLGRSAVGGAATDEPPTDAVPELPAPPPTVVDPVPPAPIGGAAAPTPPLLLTAR